MYRAEGFVYNDFVFAGTSLGFGAGEVKKLKWSMDLKQRFTEVIRLIYILTKVWCHLKLRRPFQIVCDIGFWLFSQVFSVNNVNVVIRTRTEHLTDEEKARIKSRWKICTV